MTLIAHVKCPYCDNETVIVPPTEGIATYWCGDCRQDFIAETVIKVYTLGEYENKTKN